ncbi:MAG: bifunctional 2-polyprenyl-6-hydroxyphenol methylase/3-demethylubiquinol 3-O-methyltransferase UbiG [Pseudomonadota bacterium]|nr:bifunctional 2-polyprenyl-6-hydroxyphenol methylase/3-demethylubiquinol 3-O-methyltransferase UbiG [Pseudomonadota bacterium]
MPRRQAASISNEEIAQFSRHAEDWWRADGPFRPLHKLNPVRLAYIRDQACGHFGRDPQARFSLENLQILDAGCGGGLLTEPLARLGGRVSGLDASQESIAVAAAHAEASGLSIQYEVGSLEDLAQDKKRYDLITALEIVEHVADLDSFLHALVRLLKPRGLLIMSTLNRTPKSFLLGIIAAEYILGWVPKGTHQWLKFLRPSELSGRLEKEGLQTSDVTGLVFNLLRGEFELRDDLAVNYLLAARRAR